jgi:large subunit ribosomal protein L5
MSAPVADAPPARLKSRYFEEIRPNLIERFGYSSVMQAPHLEKITLNMGVGLAKQDAKVLKAATEQLATIAGQQPSVRRARKSIAAFKLREGMPVGVAVTLRGERAYEFLDRLVSIAIPRIRDFRGLNPRSFDGRGNYTIGVREQIIFPEIDYDAIDQVRGLDITITTSAGSDVEAFALLQALGMPFASQGRPKGYDPKADEAEAEAHAAAEAAKAAEAANPTPKPAAKKAPKATPEPEPESVPDPEPAAEATEEQATAEVPASGATDESAEQTEQAADGEEPQADGASEPAAEAEAPAEDSNEKESDD